jgi:hypothetical protein
MVRWSRCTYGDDPVDARLCASCRGLDTQRSDHSETTAQFDAAGRERGDRLGGLDEFELVDVDQLPPGGGPDRLDFPRRRSRLLRRRMSQTPRAVVNATAVEFSPSVGARSGFRTDYRELGPLLGAPSRSRADENR